jgi:hypothetical protein
MNEPGSEEEKVRLAHLAGRTLRQREIDRFRALGVDIMTLALPWPVLGDRVIFHEGESFDFARDANDGEIVSAFTLGVLGIGGLVDLVAWEPAGGRTALWLRRGFALGEQQIFRHQLDNEPLPVWRSPLGWLRAARMGLVILRPEVAHIWLAEVPSILAEDADHVSGLERLLRPPQPKTQILATAKKIAHPPQARDFNDLLVGSAQQIEEYAA